MRRLLRECFRLSQDKVVSGIDLVIVPKRRLDPRSLDLAMVQAEMLPLLATVARSR